MVRIPLTNRETSLKKQNDDKPLNKIDILKNALIVAVLGVVIGLLAPFGMHKIPVLTSVSYWVISCLVGFVIYLPCIHLSDIKLKHIIKRKWLRVGLGCIPASLLMSIAAAVLTWLFFDVRITLGWPFLENVARTSLIGGILTTATFFREVFESQQEQLSQTEQQLNVAKLSPEIEIDLNYQEFMTMLPLEYRGQLLCLQMSDHYLTVHTDKGRHTMLMRLKDAMVLLRDYDGMQTHRSWWVAHDAVVKIVKDGRKTHLILSNDLTVPVSRSFLVKVSAAGFAK